MRVQYGAAGEWGVCGQGSLQGVQEGKGMEGTSPHLTSPSLARAGKARKPGPSLGAVSAGGRHDGPGLARLIRFSRRPRPLKAPVDLLVVPGLCMGQPGKLQVLRYMSGRYLPRVPSYPTSGHTAQPGPRPGGCACAMSERGSDTRPTERQPMASWSQPTVPTESNPGHGISSVSRRTIDRRYQVHTLSSMDGWVGGWGYRWDTPTACCVYGPYYVCEKLRTSTTYV